MTDRTRNELHPTQKPIELMLELVGLTHGIVLDPFMGSGSTLVAAALLGRQAIGIELNAEYVRIAEERITRAMWCRNQL